MTHPASQSFRRFLAALTVLLMWAIAPASAQDKHPGEPGYLEPAAPLLALSHFGSSPFAPPEESDQTFVVDEGPGLDTGCTFRGGGPLVFSIKVDRVVGDVALLLANDMISENAVLRMPAFDVDFDAVVPPYAPERDRVSFNGNVVPTDWLTGANGIWKLNGFNVPIEWVNFPSDPGTGGTASEEDNTIRIDIDVDNAGVIEAWCTAIDWAALTIEVADPVVMAHGILSDGSVWSRVWVPRLDQLGLPNSNNLNMGNLDGIAANAGKIAAEVSASKNRWGVEKVVLVTHSKGGLDSRHFVETSGDAGQLVQIGTPNGGSPLADAVQVGSVILVGPFGTAIINALAGPAGVQLTTPFMAGYNLFHGSNPQVLYTALAGDYDPNCFVLNPFCNPLERLMLAITGQGDTIVPLSSIHTLSYTQNRTFNSSGDIKEATHTGLPQSNAVFDELSDRVKAQGTRAPATAGLPTSPFTTTASILDLIQQGETQDHALAIDEQVQAFIPLLYPSGDLDLVLISPSGVVIDPAAADADPDMSFEAGEILGGQVEVYNLGLPEVGVWTVRVSAPSVTESSGEVGYSVVAWLDSPSITFGAKLASPAAASGDPLTLLGRILESGSPLTDASVQATIALPDDSRQSVLLYDDGSGGDDTAGDGVYTAVFTDTVQSGNYRMAFIAERSGSPAGPDFSREAFVLAAVSSSSSSFAGTFRDFGLDSDGDGLFNELIVEVDLDVTDTADYRIFAVLQDAAGNTQQTNVLTNLAPGIQTVELSFDGATIFQNGVDGPYSLSELRLAEEAGLALLPLDELAGAYDTAAYGYFEFQHAPIVLTGDGSSVGRDTNANGLFDFLDVSIEVLVDDTGFYNWSARLVNDDGTELGFAASSSFFNAGLNSLTLSFQGEPIGENATDGPYFVNDLLLFSSIDSLVASRALETGAFLASQFEGFVGDVIPPTLGVTPEPVVLWPPNHRMVEIEALVTVTDDTDPTPDVTLVSIDSNEPNPQGTDIQNADFGTDDRLFNLRAERLGNGEGRVYTIVYRAEDDSGNATETTVTVTVPHDMGEN